MSCKPQAAKHQLPTAFRAFRCFCCFCRLADWLCLLCIALFVLLPGRLLVGWLVGCWLLVLLAASSLLYWLLRAELVLCAVRCAAACSLKRQTSKKSVNWVERTFALLLYNEAQRTKRCDATRRDATTANCLPSSQLLAVAKQLRQWTILTKA